MSRNLKPYFRILLIIIIGVMLYFVPTREFLKLTFMLGMPFILMMSLMIRRPRYSLVWNICALGLLGVLVLYVYYLVHLPERIQVREIISSGAALVAEGQYDAAIERYSGLEQLGKAERMKEEIQKTQNEKEASLQLENAKQLIEEGKRDEAMRIIEALPRDTRAYYESRKILKSLEQK